MRNGIAVLHAERFRALAVGQTQAGPHPPARASSLKLPRREQWLALCLHHETNTRGRLHGHGAYWKTGFVGGTVEAECGEFAICSPSTDSFSDLQA